MWVTGNLRYRITEKIDLNQYICQIFGITKEDLGKLEIIKKSIDARKKNMIYINFSVRACIKKDSLKDMSLLGKYDFAIISVAKTEEIIHKRKFSSKIFFLFSQKNHNIVRLNLWNQKTGGGSYGRCGYG